jgi:hypothetical protein
VLLGATWSDDDLSLLGCGMSETVLVAIEAPSPWGDPEDPDELQLGVEIAGQVQGVLLSDLAVEGGDRGVIVRDGAGSEREVVLRRVRVEGAMRSGVVVTGLDTQLRAEDVEVDSVLPLPSGAAGFGIALQAGGSVWDVPTGVVTIEGGFVRQAHRVGVLVDRSRIEIAGLLVEETSPLDDGTLGRGIQLQNGVTGVLDSVVASGNSDAAVFLHMPADVTLLGCTLSGTALASIPGLPDQPSGDGLVATQASAGFEPGDFHVTLQDNVFSDNGRAGALIEGVSVTGPSGDVFSGNGLVTDGETFPVAPSEDALLLQDGATATGPAIELGGASGFPVLDINREPLELQ